MACVDSLTQKEKLARELGGRSQQLLAGEDLRDASIQDLVEGQTARRLESRTHGVERQTHVERQQLGSRAGPLAQGQRQGARRQGTMDEQRRFELGEGVLHQLAAVARGKVFIAKAQAEVVAEILERRLEIADLAQIAEALEIFGKRLDEVAVNTAHGGRIALGGPAGHGLGHAADQQVVAQQLARLLVERRENRPALAHGALAHRRGQVTRQHLAPVRREELEVGEGPQHPEGDAADRKREPPFLEPHLEQRPRRHHVELRVILAQEAQPGHCLRAFLDLVEKQERPEWEALYIVARRKRDEELVGRPAGAHQRQVLEALEVELEKEVETFGQPAHGLGLARLPRPAHHTGLAVDLTGPGGQDRVDAAGQIHRLES